MNAKKALAKGFLISSILAEDLSKSEMMQLKMSVFKQDCVKNCKDRELLTNLRKAQDPIDIIMYYGMIRNVDSV